MKHDFYIVEDDASVARILENIIEEYQLGYVCGYSCKIDDVLNDVFEGKPDIILIDFLMPEEDGLEVLKKIVKSGFSGKFIMISEVTTKKVIGEAYRLGVEYFINKPINVIEVVKVIEKVSHTIQNEKVIDLLGIRNFESSKVRGQIDDDELSQIFRDLGIIGQSGLHELTEIIKKITKEKDSCQEWNYNMADLYQYIVESASTHRLLTNTKAVEQRLRRLCLVAMQNIASIGLEDFSNYRFEKYATSVFNYKDIRMEMDYLREKSPYRGKVNIKKFIEGIVALSCR
jgi:two-component system, response regulator YcbB